MISRPRRRPRQIRVALNIADRALRAEIADACEDADIAVAASPPYPSPQAAEGREWEDADLAVTDRLTATAIPAIALASAETHRIWPANVRAVVPADVDPATLAAIITVVAAGYALAPPKELPGDDRGAWADPGDASDELAGALSPREREVLALVAEGASNKEIAGALALSVSTVKFHVAAIMEKLGAGSRVEAVAIAIRAGLVML
ncbi:MAG TPA: response regulator transcription factor [Xanthobacteraceae bacterium]|nr:response regulator transcription factor [Xanthobacteraceae bacterium]